MNIWTYVKADPFFKSFLPDILNHRHKIGGKNGRGNPFEGFTAAEKKEINKALARLLEENKL
jgi:hypothetical protein